jgi:hypothetical protein
MIHVHTPEWLFPAHIRAAIDRRRDGIPPRRVVGDTLALFNREEQSSFDGMAPNRSLGLPEFI